MGTTLPHLDEEVRAYPDNDAYGTGEIGPFPDDDYSWTGWPLEFRGRRVSAILGAVVALGAIATAVIINSGDSASTKATVGAPVPTTPTSAPATTKTSVPPSAAPSPSRVPQLPPETFTTVTPPNVGPNMGPNMGPGAVPGTVSTGRPTAAPAVAPSAAPNPRTVIYSVTGTKQLLDLVNVVYTDARGYHQTEFNVSLPWSKMVVLNPGVATESVVASSFYGRLNCSIVNAAGQPVVTSANSTNLATCAR